ncbi:MAG TPA: rod-binding protein [Arenibaculum sp.]|nr:rod-binding protein [Arenibaculum sp.]
MEITAIPAPVPNRPDTVRANAGSDPAKAAREFEAMLLGQMFEHMFEGIRASGPFGGGQAERTWRSFMVREYAASVAETGGLGIAPLVEAEIARLYGDAANAGSGE